MSKTPLQRLRALFEKGARNNANDAIMIQTMHDHSVSLGAECTSMSEAADFSQSDVMTLLNTAVRKQFKDQYSYPYICDVFDDYLVFMANYSQSSCYRCDYSVSDSGSVTLGTPIAVVRKVTYIEPNTTPASESDVSEAELVSDCVQLVENGDNTELIEANTRMLKLIAPGWGSSGYYPADVLKRDGPNVFKAGTHNYIDHLTATEEKQKPEGYLDRLASVLTEDAKWYDDYNGNGAGLYAKAKVKPEFDTFLETFGANIGTSIRANGKVKEGIVDNKKGTIIEAITSAKSVDYVTVAGAGGKVLDLVESAKSTGKTNVVVESKVKEPTNMATDQEFTALQETVNRLVTQNARLAESLTMRDAREYAARKLSNPAVKLHAATKDRILDGLVVSAPLTESGAIDYKAFDTLIETAVSNEVGYLSSVGAFGKINGFGSSKSTSETQPQAITLETFTESLKELN